MNGNQQFIIANELLFSLSIILALLEGFPIANSLMGIFSLLGLLVFNAMLIDVYFFMKKENEVVNNET